MESPTDGHVCCYQAEIISILFKNHTQVAKIELLPPPPLLQNLSAQVLWKAPSAVVAEKVPGSIVSFSTGWWW